MPAALRQRRSTGAPSAGRASRTSARAGATAASIPATRAATTSRTRARPSPRPSPTTASPKSRSRWRYCAPALRPTPAALPGDPGRHPFALAAADQLRAVAGTYRPGGRAQPSRSCTPRSTARSACARACTGAATNWPFAAAPAGFCAAPATASTPATSLDYTVCGESRLRLVITSTRRHPAPFKLQVQRP